MTVCPSSTPVVVTVTVASVSSSVEFKLSPQLKSLVAIAVMVGTVSSKVIEDVLWVAVVVFPDLSVSMALNSTFSKSVRPPLNASNSSAVKVKVLLAFRSPNNMV